MTKALQEFSNLEKIRFFIDNDVANFLKDIKKIDSGIKNSSTEKESYRKFLISIKKILKRGEVLTKNFNGDRIKVKKIKAEFRQALTPWFYQGTIMERGFQKPHGFPGDCATIEMFYNNEVKTKGFAALCDKYLLSNDYVQAVRDRKDYMKEVIISYLKSLPKNSSVKILNLGSGSCREVRELPVELIKNLNIEFFFLDQDDYAIDFSMQQLNKIHPTLKTNFFKKNILDLVKRPQNYKNEIGECDLIYSIGLADYIPDFYLGGMVSSAFSLLKQKRNMFIAHKNVVKHQSIASDWFCDWNFIPRDKGYFKKIVFEYLANNTYEYSVEDVQRGHVFFSKINKL